MSRIDPIEILRKGKKIESTYQVYDTASKEEAENKVFVDEHRITHEAFEIIALSIVSLDRILPFDVAVGCIEWPGSKIIQFIVGRRA